MTWAAILAMVERSAELTAADDDHALDLGHVLEVQRRGLSARAATATEASAGHVLLLDDCPIHGYALEAATGEDAPGRVAGHALGAGRG
jgi:hypothetical protein